ncbi:hypothetical protein Y032_0039g20 [Ancylostoma ceylanicum]|uniref:Transposase n=2 Tax=Ancylostoma ceylanicum TaxID=53326 RepID=A0A016UJT8_9BILA|nr:hypothetical protein Y032_0039g20 [Ancylostoma ceylanicum]
MLGLSLRQQKERHLHNSDVRALSKVHDAVLHADESKHRYAGHLMRCKDGRWCSAALRWYPRDKKRPRGRPLRSTGQLRLKTGQCGREVGTRARPTAVLRNGSSKYLSKSQWEEPGDGAKAKTAFLGSFERDHVYHSDQQSLENLISRSDKKHSTQMPPSKAVEEGHSSPEQISTETLLDESPSPATTSEKPLFCSFCERQFPESKLREVSYNPEQSLILLSCLVMDNTIKGYVAASIWKEINGVNKLICKQHYVQAAWSIGEEVRRMWSKYPVNGLQQVPADIQGNLLKRIQTFAKMFDKDTKLSLKDLWSFYDLCQSFYASGSRGRSNSQITVENSESSQSEVKLSSKETHEVPGSSLPRTEIRTSLRVQSRKDGAAKEQSSSWSEVDDSSSDDTINEEVPKKRTPHNVICKICHNICPDGQIRGSSRHRDFNIVLLSCLVLCGEIDIEQAKESYLQTLMTRKRFCQQHFVQAVKYLWREVYWISKKRPTPDFQHIPYKARHSIMTSIQKCSAIIDKSVQVSVASVRRFYTDCYGKYHSTRDWKEIDKKIPNSRAPPQAVRTVTGASRVSTAKSLGHGIKRPGSHLGEGSMEGSSQAKKSASVGAATRSQTTGTSVGGSSTSRDDGRASCSQNDSVIISSEDNDADIKISEFTVGSEQNDEKDVTSFLLNKYIPTTTYTKEPTASDLLKTETCNLCDVIGPAIDFIAASVEPQHNIVLLSFLIMQNLVEIGRAVDFYNRVQSTPTVLCKSHYIKAATRLAKDIKKGWKSWAPGSSEETLAQLDYALSMIVLYRDLIDAKLDLQRSHIKKFFDECLEKFWMKNRWTPYKLQGGLRLERAMKSKPHVVSSALHEDHTYNTSIHRELCKQKKKKAVAVKQPSSKARGPTEGTVDPSSADDCPPLFDTEKDEKPPFSEGISAADLIEQVEHKEENSPEGSSSENDQGNSTTDPRENSDIQSSAVQMDEKDPRISQADDNLPSTSTELFLNANPEIKEEVEDEDEIVEEPVRQNRSPRRSEESIIRSLMEADPTKSISELARELKISSKAVVSYLHNSGSSAEKEVERWVPDERTLQCRVEVCSSLLLRNIRDPFLDRIVVYGEKWIYFENRKRATVWLDDAVPICSESTGGQPGEKVLLTMWWTSIGVIHYHIVPGGKPMSEDKFPRQITNMYKKLELKQPNLVSELDVKGLFLLCDNPRPYTSLKSTLKLHQYRFEVLPHPPQSPDLLPSNYHVFRHLNCDLAGRNFYYEAEVERAFLSFVASRKREFFTDGLTELALRWRKCVSSNGGYFNKS